MDWWRLDNILILLALGFWAVMIGFVVVMTYFFKLPGFLIAVGLVALWWWRSGKP